MTRDEAITRVRRALGHNESLQQAYIIDALQDAQDALEQEPELPWFLRTEVSSIFTQANEERIPLPPDFLTIVEDDALWIYDAAVDPKWTELKKDELDYLRTTYGSADPARPCMYALDKDYFRLFPTPDAAYELRMIYMRRQDALDSNVENAWLANFPWLLISIAVQQLGMGTRDADAITLAAQREAQERDRLNTMNVGREMTNRQLIMGDPD